MNTQILCPILEAAAVSMMHLVVHLEVISMMVSMVAQDS